MTIARSRHIVSRVESDSHDVRPKRGARARWLQRAGITAALVLSTTAAMVPSLVGHIASARAQLPTSLNDLADLGAGEGQVIAAVPQQLYKPAPTLTENDAKCPSGPHTEPGVDGRVPAGSADSGGLYCH